MTIYNINLNEDFDDYWIDCVSKWLKKKYVKKYLEECYNNNYYSDIIEELYKDTPSGITICTTDELKNAIIDAIKDDKYYIVKSDILGLIEFYGYYNSCIYWGYNGNPIPLNKETFGRAMKKIMKG